MPSLLESTVKKKIASGFKGKLCKGTLRRENVSALDSRGNPVTVSAKSYTIEGIRENISARYADKERIPVTDVAILIILGLGSLNTNNITPQQGDKVFIGVPFNKWHEVRRILEIDPAGASCRMAAFEINAP